LLENKETAVHGFSPTIITVYMSVSKRCGKDSAKAYPTTNKTLALRSVSRIKAHVSISSITGLSRRDSIGGVATGVGGTLSNAEENIPSKDEDEFARFKLANDRNDVFRVLPRPGKLK
jgi:pantothenate kinase